MRPKRVADHSTTRSRSSEMSWSWSITEGYELAGNGAATLGARYPNFSRLYGRKSPMRPGCRHVQRQSPLGLKQAPVIVGRYIDYLAVAGLHCGASIQSWAAREDATNGIATGVRRTQGSTETLNISPQTHARFAEILLSDITHGTRGELAIWAGHSTELWQYRNPTTDPRGAV